MKTTLMNLSMKIPHAIVQCVNDDQLHTAAKPGHV